MKETIKRLKKEKKALIDKYYEYGIFDGQEWGSQASYDDIIYAIDYKTCDEILDNDKRAINIDPTRDNVLGEFFNHAMARYEHFGFKNLPNRGFIPNDFYIAWEYGWKKGVVKFWEEVEPKLE